MREMLGIEGKSVEKVRKMKPFATDSKEDIQKMFESGLSSLINRLALGISSLHAENTSVKLKKEIQSIADQLLKSEIIFKEQRKKIFL